jgi:hypothetical protein
MFKRIPIYIYGLLILLGLLFVLYNNNLSNSDKNPFGFILEFYHDDKLSSGKKWQQVEIREIKIVGLEKTIASDEDILEEFEGNKKNVENFKKSCEDWTWTDENTKVFFKKAKPMPDNDWEENFLRFACEYKGNVKFNDNLYARFSINGGGWGFLEFSDTTYTLGYYEEKLPFMSYYLLIEQTR